MKVKSAHETAGIGKGHKYLGHFAKAKNINKGHNTVEDDTDPEMSGQTPYVAPDVTKPKPKSGMLKIGINEDTGKKQGLIAMIKGGS